jgi:hypothetical protein
MTRRTTWPVLISLAIAVSGCSSMKTLVNPSGSSAEFIAGNSTEVLIDTRHGRDADLAAARTLANDKCTLFGKNSAVLQSINPHSEDTDRVVFA